MSCHGYRDVAGYWPGSRMMAGSGSAFKVVQDGVGVKATQQVCIWAEASLIFALLGLFLMVVSLTAGAVVDSLGVASGVLALFVIGRCRRQGGLGYALLGILLAAAPLVLMILSGV